MGWTVQSTLTMPPSSELNTEGENTPAAHGAVWRAELLALCPDITLPNPYLVSLFNANYFASGNTTYGDDVTFEIINPGRTTSVSPQGMYTYHFSTEANKDLFLTQSTLHEAERAVFYANLVSGSISISTQDISS